MTTLNSDLASTWIVEAWAEKPEGVKMELFVEYLQELGNLVTEVDMENDRVRIGVFTNENKDN